MRGPQVRLFIGLNVSINIKQRGGYRSFSFHTIINSYGFHIIYPRVPINHVRFYRCFNYFLIRISVFRYFISNSFRTTTIFRFPLLPLIAWICVFCLRYLESIVGRCGHANLCIKHAVCNANAICFVIFMYSGYAIGIIHTAIKYQLHRYYF